MATRKKDSFGLFILIAVIIAAFFWLNPFFRFSCSRVFLHDFFGLGHDMLTPGIIFTDFNLVRMVPLALMFFICAAVALWVYHDAERRGHSGLLWGLFVFVGNIIGLIIYLIVRSSPEDRGASVLAPATSPCPSCGQPVQKTYVACPHCGTNLAKKCASCGRNTDLDWKVCPYCGQTIE
jgi:hypothetical protein